MTQGKVLRRAGSWLAIHVGARKWPDNAYRLSGKLPQIGVKPWAIVEKIVFHFEY